MPLWEVTQSETVATDLPQGKEKL